MRTPAALAFVSGLLAFIAPPHATAQSAAPAAKTETRYLVADGQVFEAEAVVVAGATFVALDQVASLLGFETVSTDKGAVLRSPKGTITFAEDYSMAVVGAHLHAVRPPGLRLGTRVYVPETFVAEHFARFASAPFTIRATPPAQELKTLPCSIRAEGDRWILGFESPPAYATRPAEGRLDIFFEGQRLRTSAGGESPPGVRLRHDRQPLGDRLSWSWDKASPFAAEVAASADGLEIVVAFSAPGPREARALTTVILDPGHGGQATGAVGRRGLLEKDLALRIASKVRDLLQKQGLRVLMTRETDTDVSLAERAEFANSRRGDLFVSIHANASRRASARGAETYFMSYEALDEESRLVAEIENRETSAAAAPSGAADGDPVGAILATMAQARFLSDSSRLAETIQRHFNAALATPDRGVKQAPFAVLTGVAMPAVLVEVGFLSHPEEERLLEREDYRDRIARAIADSVLAFKAATEERDRKRREAHPRQP